MKPEELYELHAAAASHVAHTFQPHVRNVRLAAWVASVLPRERATTAQILEVGFGDAELTLAIARDVAGVRVHGVDLASARVDRARALGQTLQFGDRATFATLDAEKGLPGQAETYDVTLAIDVLEHVFDVFGFVSELARVTKVGGTVLLRVPNIAYLRHRWSLARGALPITSSWFGPSDDLTAWRTTWGWDGGHLHFFTHKTLTKLLEEAGLRVVQWRDPGSRGEPLRRLRPQLLLGNLCVRAERVR